MAKWDRVLRSWDPATDPALAELVEMEDEGKRLSTLEDCMARKAPSTMLKRANSLLRLTGVCSKEGLAMVIAESDLYQLLRDIKGSGASLSQIRGIMEAVTFCRYVFSMSSMDILCKSSRCWGVGAAKQAYIPTKASPLRVVDLERLHEILANDVDAWQRLFAGCCLFCAYGRTRWSDAQHVDVFTFDKDPGTGEIVYIEAVVQVHKTQNLQGRSPRCLELVAPGKGVVGESWIQSFLDARESLNLGDQHPFMPAPDMGGLPTVRALGTDECGAWLESLLVGRDGQRTTSHSLKATMLSYCAKFGVSHQDRLALGGHSHPGRMADTYGRDALARPLRLLGTVIQAIRNKEFLPDVSRAGRFTRQEPVLTDSWDQAEVIDLPNRFPDQVLPKLTSENLRAHEACQNDPEVVVKAEKEVCLGSALGAEEINSSKEDRISDRSSSGNATSSDSDSSSSLSSTQSQTFALPRRKVPEPPAGHRFVQHKKIMTLHFQKNEHYRFTICGRKSEAPLGPPVRIRPDTPICRNCRRSLNQET